MQLSEVAVVRAFSRPTSSIHSGIKVTKAMDSSKSRRELFEEQLKDLQKDISSLSQKLSIPTMVTASRLGGSTTSSINGYTEAKIDTSFLSAHTKDGLSNSVASFAESRNGYGRETSPQQLEQVTNDLKEAYRERDEARRRVEQLTAENEELKKGLPEFARIKAAHDSLKQDNDALRISLESSERIRNQQKELIIVLQKSNAMIGESSILSFNSMSSISHKPESAPVSAVPVDLLAQEHQQWLNRPKSAEMKGKNGSAAGIAFKAPPKITVSSSKSSLMKAVSPSPVGRKPVSSTAKSPYSQSVLNKKKRKKSSKQQLQSSTTAHTTTSNILSHDISASYQDIMRQNASLLSKQSFPALAELSTGGINRLNSFTSTTPLAPQISQSSIASDYQVGSLAAKYALQREKEEEEEDDNNGRPPLYPPTARPFAPDAPMPQNQLHVYPMGRTGVTVASSGRERSQSEPNMSRSAKKAGITSSSKKKVPTKKMVLVSPKSANSVSKVLYRPVSSPLTTFGASRRIV